jgi:hypothetical protein
MEKPKFNFGYLKLPEEMDFFKPEGGTEIIMDIVPYIVTDPNHLDKRKNSEDANEGEMWWKRPVRVHRDVGPEMEVVICPTTFGDKCPICEYANQQKREGAEWDDIQNIFPKNRSIMYVVPLDTAELEKDYKEGEVHIMDISDKNFTEILKQRVLRDISNEGFPDPEDGLSLKMFFNPKKFKKVTFGELANVEFIDREEQYGDEFVEGLPSLDDLLEVHDYNTLKTMYFGMEGMDDEIDETPFAEDEEDTKPKRTRKTTRQREEDAPEEKPKRTRKPKEDPEPEPEPEEETKPARKKPARKKPTPKEDKKECPHKLKFGEDFDQYDVCDDCELWEDCKEANKTA